MKINNLAWVPNIVAIILTVLIVLIGSLVYNYKIKKYQKGEVTTGYCLVVEIFVEWCTKTVIEMGGKRIKWAAPYFAFLLIYISLNNLVSLLGISNPISQLTIPIALGSFTLLGVLILALRFKNVNYYKEFLNPFSVLGKFSPFLSLSFRLFGNIFGGVVLLSLIYSVTGLLWGFIPIIGQINVLGGFLLPPFHFYFDIFQGILQSYVFGVLTISYWGNVIEEAHESNITKKNKYKTNKEEQLNVV